MPNRGGGSDQIGRLTKPPYLVTRNVKTTSHFLKVTPLIWASEGQINESKSYKVPNLLGWGGGPDEVWQMTQDYNFFCFEGFPKQIQNKYFQTCY